MPIFGGGEPRFLSPGRRNRIAWRRQPQDRDRIKGAWAEPPDGGDTKGAPLRHKGRALTRRALRYGRIRGSITPAAPSREPGIDTPIREPLSIS